MDETDKSIASPHWEACNSCVHLGENGCSLSGDIKLSVYLGDWIICDDCQSHNHANAPEPPA